MDAGELGIKTMAAEQGADEEEIKTNKEGGGVGEGEWGDTTITTMVEGDTITTMGGRQYPNNGYNNNNNQSRMPNGGNMNNSYNNYNNNNRGQGLKNTKIEAMMRAYRQKFPGAVNVFLILDVCGYRLTDLPPAGIVDKDTGKQMFCCGRTD